MSKLLLFVFTILIVYKAVESQFAQCTNGETCLPFKECEPLRKLTEKGRLTPEETQLLRKKQCDSINRVAYVCCSSAPVVASRLTTALPKPPICGRSLDNKIFGGEATNIDEFPWTAQIQYRKPRDQIGSHCGGSLISDRHVLTAAHCVQKVPKTWTLFQVRLGDWDTTTNPDCQEFYGETICNNPYVEVPVSDIIVHENYIPQAKNQHHDIALLKLQRNVEFTNFISPICLPVENSLRSTDYTRHNLEVAGFGKTESGTASLIKLKVALEVLAQDKCINFYNNLNVEIINQQMCAGGEEGRDSCNGDSGGPIMKYGTYSNSELPYYMLVGLVSFGPKNCGTLNAPGVYTRVSEYVDWINRNMN